MKPTIQGVQSSRKRFRIHQVLAGFWRRYDVTVCAAVFALLFTAFIVFMFCQAEHQVEAAAHWTEDQTSPRVLPQPGAPIFAPDAELPGGRRASRASGGGME